MVKPALCQEVCYPLELQPRDNGLLPDGTRPKNTGAKFVVHVTPYGVAYVRVPRLNISAISAARYGIARNSLSMHPSIYIYIHIPNISLSLYIYIFLISIYLSI